MSIFTFLAEFLETCLMGANDDLITIKQSSLWEKTAQIDHIALSYGELENHQVLSFQSGFRDLKNDRI